VELAEEADQRNEQQREGWVGLAVGAALEVGDPFVTSTDAEISSSWPAPSAARA